MEPQFRMGMTVQATDGAAGRINDVLVERDGGRLYGLVVQGNGFFSNDVVVPAEVITNVAEGRVYVRLNRGEVKKLPVYSATRFGAAQGLVSQAATNYDRHDRDKKGS